MDFHSILAILKDFLVWILAFSFLLGYSSYLGVRSVTNLILGVYFAILVWLTFPHHSAFIDIFGASAIARILFFAVIVVGVTYLLHAMFPRFDERVFERFGKKALYALAGSVLLMVVSYHILPVTELVTIGSPIATLFSAKEYFFYWLMLPFLVISFL